MTLMLSDSKIFRASRRSRSTLRWLIISAEAALGPAGCARRICAGVVRALVRLKLYYRVRLLTDRIRHSAPGYPQRRRMDLAFYSRFISKGDLCFDIGANMGLKTDIFLGLGASVVAVEPQEICMGYLRRKYRETRRVILVQKAVGAEGGEKKMMVSSSHTISSMSKRWIESVKASGRFRSAAWHELTSVRVTTLDALIDELGKPAFCKIDVEGFEGEVLRGLSQPIQTVCFEFTPEFIDAAIDCIRHLSKIGCFRFNYCVGDTTRFALPKYVGGDEMCRILTTLPDRTVFGDVYARLVNRSVKSRDSVCAH